MTAKTKPILLFYSRPDLDHHPDELIDLINLLNKYGFEYRLNAGFAEVVLLKAGLEIDRELCYESSADFPSDDSILICYGGDGTFLDGVQLLNNLPIAILGVNSGRLGFLTSTSKERIESVLERLAQGEYTVEERTMLHVRGDFPTLPGFPYAFNEFSIQRHGASMISVEVYLGNELISKYWGDGVILSTPAGSTAYSLSVGGPIVTPSCNCFVLSPIASHNLTMRPIVLHDTAKLMFRVSSRDEVVYATLDNRTFALSNDTQFEVSKAPESIRVITLAESSFYDTLRTKLMWGYDHRS